MIDAKQTGSTTSLATEILLKQPMVPEAIKRVFRHAVGGALSSDEMLWREVASRMTLDALGYTPETINVKDGMEERRFDNYRRTVNAARRWFMSRYEQADSDAVFEFCGIDITPVRSHVASLAPVVVPATLKAKNGGSLVTRHAA